MLSLSTSFIPHYLKNTIKSLFDCLPKYFVWFVRFVFVVKLTLNDDHKPKYFNTNIRNCIQFNRLRIKKKWSSHQQKLVYNILCHNFLIHFKNQQISVSKISSREKGYHINIIMEVKYWQFNKQNN